jgi:hypothetical protein
MSENDAVGVRDTTKADTMNVPQRWVFWPPTFVVGH